MSVDIDVDVLEWQEMMSLNVALWDTRQCSSAFWDIYRQQGKLQMHVRVKTIVVKSHVIITVVTAQCPGR